MKTILLLTMLFSGFSAIAQSPATLEVTVVNPAGKPYSGDKVYFVGQKTKKTLSGITNASGKFRVDLPQGDVYDIRIQSIGEDLEYNTVEIPTIGAGAHFELMEVLITYEASKEYTLSSLQFETAKAVIQPGSLPMLDNIAEIMQLKKEMKIEIAGHTDSDGDAAANQLLSQQRADAVKAYLVKKGVSASRIKSAGYGETKPVASNTTASGKQQNRRTEVKVL